MNRTAEKMRQTAEKMQKAADEMRQAGSGTAKAADDAAMVKDYDTAAKYCFQYLKLKPGDVDVQVLLAETFGRAAKDRGSKVQAVNDDYQAIGASVGEKSGPAAATGRTASGNRTVRSSRRRGGKSPRSR